MPWCEIPPDRLSHITLFGYDVVSDENGLLWVHGPLGRTSIDKTKPIVWFDDLADAAQAGAISVLQPDQ